MNNQLNLLTFNIIMELLMSNALVKEFSKELEKRNKEKLSRNLS